MAEMDASFPTALARTPQPDAACRLVSRSPELGASDYQSQNRKTEVDRLRSGWFNRSGAFLVVPSMPLGWQSYAISIASFVAPTSNGLSRVLRTFLPSPSEMIAHDRWFNHFRLITTPMISRIHD